MATSVQKAKKDRKIGVLGEKCAVKHLVKQGYVIRETNWRYKNMGEIDIIASRETEDGTELAIFEVKSTVIRETFTEMRTILPEDRITTGKLRKIRTLATVYQSFFCVDKEKDIATTTLRCLLLSVYLNLSIGRYSVKEIDLNA